MIVPRPSVLHVLKDLDWSDVGFGFVKAGTWIVCPHSGDSDRYQGWKFCSSQCEAEIRLASLGLEPDFGSPPFVGGGNWEMWGTKTPDFAVENGSLEEYRLKAEARNEEPDGRAGDVFFVLNGGCGGTLTW